MKFPRLCLAGTASNTGKTTVACALLQALKNRKKEVCSFKCGPAYLDPLFHECCIGAKARNLDPFFTDAETTRFLFCRNAAGMELSILEGVMGYYDGLGGDSTRASTYELAQLTETPTVLVVPCKGMSVSILAVIRGFLDYAAPNFLSGVILNQISPMLYPKIKEKIEGELGIAVLGYLPPCPAITLPSRHLGLIPAQEIAGMRDILQKLAQQAEETLDIDGILQLAQTAPPLPLAAMELPFAQGEGTPVIAVAKDAAFCFHYADNLDLLQDLGGKIRFFSPLKDAVLPPCDGLFLGGGYPELHAKALSENRSMRESIRAALAQNLPCVAEGGGFLYLHRSLQDENDAVYDMVGTIAADGYPTSRLQRFGYTTLTAQTDNLLCRAGEAIRSHEFHYWESGDPGTTFLSQKPSGISWPCIHADKNFFAGFPHLYFYANPVFAANFLTACRQYHSKIKD